MNEIKIQKHLITWIDCPVCKGTGNILSYEVTRYDNGNPLPSESINYECTQCQGSGKVRKSSLKRTFKKTLL